ncbi:MAG: hypothetical protein MJ060_02250 [Clostridia bacterium]|nr:hypothetical protein [Clostridia bacterium]
MKQIEITTRVLEDMTIAESKLLKLGFKKIRSGVIDDTYMCTNLDGLTESNIVDYLKQCVLIRYIDMGVTKFKKLTYKTKLYQNGVTISEEKINVEIDDTEKAKLLFKALNFKELVRVKYIYVVYEKNGFEIAFQDVDGLGLLLEYENAKDFDGVDANAILKIKQNMLDEIKTLGLLVTDEFDVKKAYELISKRK